MSIYRTWISGPITGLIENFYVERSYYKCRKKGCPGKSEPYISPPNYIYPEKSKYDYEVYAKIINLKFTFLKKDLEIKNILKKHYGIIISLQTIKRIVKIYEIFSAFKYRPIYIKKMIKNGGIFLTIKKLKISDCQFIYTFYDRNTFLLFLCRKMKKNSINNIIELLREVKARIEPLKLPIIKFIIPRDEILKKALKIVFPQIPNSIQYGKRDFYYCLDQYKLFWQSDSIFYVKSPNEFNKIIKMLIEGYNNEALRPHIYRKKIIGDNTINLLDQYWATSDIISYLPFLCEEKYDRMGKEVSTRILTNGGSEFK
ncbi:MAG: hypothetical protein ACTSRP_10480 [Candidatus Helarchaeota archaeon]